MTSSLVTVILFKRPPMPFTVLTARLLSPVLSAQFMTPIPALILNLASSWSSSCQSLPAVGPCLQLAMLFLPAVGPLFPAVVALFHPLWVRSFHLPEVLVGAAVDSSLFSTVRTCVRFTCSLHHLTFSHVLRHNFPSETAHHTPSHRLRLAASPTLRKTPPPPGTVRGGK